MTELPCMNCVTCGAPCSNHSAAGPWIPVTERLPERYANVLTTSGVHTLVAFRGGGDHWWDAWNRTVEPPTHWAEIRPVKP